MSSSRQVPHDLCESTRLCEPERYSDLCGPGVRNAYHCTFGTKCKPHLQLQCRHSCQPNYNHRELQSSDITATPATSDLVSRFKLSITSLKRQLLSIYCSGLSEKHYETFCSWSSGSRILHDNGQLFIRPVTGLQLQSKQRPVGRRLPANRVE